MKKLVTRDVFALCRCLKQIGLKEEFKNIAKEKDHLSDAFEMGYEILWKCFDMATEKNGEAALYEFFAGPFEMTAEEVAELPVSELMENVKTLARENDLVGFFKSAVQLTK